MTGRMNWSKVRRENRERRLDWQAARRELDEKQERSPMNTWRQIRAKYPGCCTGCGGDLSPGDSCWFEVEKRVLRCLGCGPDVELER